MSVVSSYRQRRRGTIIFFFSLLLLLLLDIDLAHEGESGDENISEGTINDSNSCQNSNNEECQSTDRIFMLEEIKKHDGANEGELIYLSILGKVYDVTAGEEYYSSRLKAPYAIFAGRDGVVPFITGVFTEEEAMKATDELTDQQMNSLRTEWVSFYKKEEKYPYLGKLAGKYYNVDGTPTEELQRIHQRWRNYKPPESKKKRRKKPKSV